MKSVASALAVIRNTPIVFAIKFACVSALLTLAQPTVAQTSGTASSVFGSNSTPTPPARVELAWNSKDEFLTAVKNGDLVGFSKATAQEKQMVLEALAAILNREYKTPVPTKKEVPSCQFYWFTKDMISGITAYSLETLGNNPPDFIAPHSGVKTAEAQYKGGWKDLNDGCFKTVMGKKQPLPFLKSLDLLMKEYSEATDYYVAKARAEKVAAYIAAQEKKKQAENKASEAAAQSRLDRQANQETQRRTAEAKAACQSSKEYRRYQSEVLLKNQLEIATAGRQEIDRQNAAGKVSGYVDATKLNQLGQLVVYSEEQIKSLFKIYLENGGTASSPQSIKPSGDPCADLGSPPSAEGSIDTSSKQSKTPAKGDNYDSARAYFFQIGWGPVQSSAAAKSCGESDDFQDRMCRKYPEFEGCGHVCIMEFVNPKYPLSKIIVETNHQDFYDKQGTRGDITDIILTSEKG